MAYDGEAGRQPPASSGLATVVQAHLGRASRFVDGKTRNWSLFFFFRVLSKARLAANLKQIALALDAKAAAGVAPAKLDDPQAPAQLFLDWLKVLVDAKSDDFWKTFRAECEKAGILSEVRKRESYEKPSVKRKKKDAAARKRAVKKSRPFRA